MKKRRVFSGKFDILLQMFNYKSDIDKKTKHIEQNVKENVELY